MREATVMLDRRLIKPERCGPAPEQGGAPDSPVNADGPLTEGADVATPIPPESRLRYALAPLSVALATAAQLALDPFLDDGRFPFLAFFVAIGFTTWCGGLRPALLSVTLSWLAADHFVLEPRGHGSIVWDEAQIRYPFFAVGLTVTFLGEAVRDARGRARASATEAQRAHDAQHAQQERLRITLSSIGDAVITTDPDGRVTSLNPAAERLTGAGGHEAAGRPLAEVLRTTDVMIDGVAHLTIAGATWGEAVAASRQKALIDGAGATRYVEQNAAPIRDDGGQVTGAVIVLRDVTERVRAEEALRTSEGRFRSLAEGMPHSVWMCDPGGRTLYLNRVWYDYTGTPPGSDHGPGWLDRFHPDDRPRLTGAWAEAQRPGGPDVFDIEARIRRHDGAYHWFRVKGSPLGDGGRAVRWVGTCTDVHEQRRLVDALREADRRKDEFLAMLAHELRNPLAPIHNAAAVMALAEDDREAQRWSREVIDRQVRHLSSLVDDLLDVGRITQGKITLTRAPLEVGTFLGAAVETSRPLIDARRHRLEVSLPKEVLCVEGDPTRLAQVVSNLLNNAAKYTPEGGHIRLYAGRDGDEAVIRVQDDGEGISPEMLPRVFDLFSQASRSSDRSEGGLGIGLTLVQRLVGMHGGTVEARSAGPRHGSEFVVRLPLLRSGAPATPPPGGAAPGPGRPRRILVVDDSRDTADTLARLLRQLGHEVGVAYEGPSACQAAVTLTPDVALLDLGLPGMDGYEVARRLRSEPSLDGVCLVALTGYGSESDRRKSEAAGFDAHLIKPVEFDALRRVLEAAQVVSSSGPA
jgi:PAS domain S-box-containing protein